MQGTPFGRYRLIELLGRGGMGEVWRARDAEANDRMVAIKLLPPHLASDSTYSARFRREAHAAARLNDPHIVPIHNYGEIDGRLYVDMRLVEGRDLEEVMSDGPMQPQRAVSIIEQVAKALHAAHRAGLVHRDVKPSNVLLDADDFAYLIDFGIARAADDTRLTEAGFAPGTLRYMAPERFREDLEDEGAGVDVYALACSLYECLTGEPPFRGTDHPSLIAAHLNSPPPKPSTTRPHVPAQLDAVIAKGMAKDPGERYATTVDLANAARAAVSDPASQTATLAAAKMPGTSPRSARSPRLGRRTKIALLSGVGVVAVVAVVAVVFGMVRGGRSPSTADSATSASRSWSSQHVLPISGLDLPGQVAVDPVGNVYVADYGHDRVVKLTAGTLDQVTLPFSQLVKPSGVAVDSSGNVYVADYGNRRVLKLPAGSSEQEVLPFDGLDSPENVAVDSAGALYVTDRMVNRVVKLPAGSSSQEVLPFGGLNAPYGVAVDPGGNVYVSDAGNARVVKLAAGSVTQDVLPFSELDDPSGVAVGPDGGVYVTDHGSQRVATLGAGSSSQQVLPFNGLEAPTSVAVDSAGSVYVTDDPQRVLKLPVG
ncbi:protein kinase [Mycobacterium yunnanensis]|uniref:non-specific serine/threonine protein kinase n=1 Tax=Mycobacterium yunnanensis TaxID=368477 RepID=A0A9X2Z4P5_9MYCO|nr:serine/threonine-protein kinase PknD [Mycobacterium yunnanensis]MCV7423475.1 protein kinase [Mycobacterium yunnanensis]